MLVLNVGVQYRRTQVTFGHKMHARVWLPPLFCLRVSLSECVWFLEKQPPVGHKRIFTVGCLNRQQSLCAFSAFKNAKCKCEFYVARMKCPKPTCLSALKTVTSNINSIGSLYSIKSTFVSRKFLTLQQTDNLTVDILLYRLWRYMYPVVWKCSQSQLIQTGVGRTFGECTCNGSVSRVTTVPRGVYLPQPEQHPQEFGQPSELRTHASLKHSIYMYLRMYRLETNVNV